MRAAIVAPLAWLGLALDDATNAHARPDADVMGADARVWVLVIHTRETLMVAREVRNPCAAMNHAC